MYIWYPIARESGRYEWDRTVDDHYFIEEDSIVIYPKRVFQVNGAWSLSLSSGGNLAILGGWINWG